MRYRSSVKECRAEVTSQQGPRSRCSFQCGSHLSPDGEEPFPQNVSRPLELHSRDDCLHKGLHNISVAYTVIQSLDVEKQSLFLVSLMTETQEEQSWKN